MLRIIFAVLLIAASAAVHAQGDPAAASSSGQAAAGQTAGLSIPSLNQLSPIPNLNQSQLAQPKTCLDKEGKTIPFGDGCAQQAKQRVQMPVQAETEFQKFVEESIGNRLPMYGYSMFDAAPDTFAPLENVPVTADYAVGPGDEIVIKAWGQIDADLRLKVDRTGAIYIPKVGSVNVAGVKYQDLKGTIANAIGKNYRNFDLGVNMGQLRSIQVYVVGQARRPGSYTVSSLSTLVNAIFASGGPSPTGSMRRIQLKRKGQVVTEFDAYDFLLKGDKTKDEPLLDGDVIYIPPIGPVAAIAGSVNNPAIFELRDKSDLADLVRMAGGLSTTAAGQRVEVDRIEDRKDRTVADFDLDQKGMARDIRDGDLVKVFSISRKFDNAVTLRGNVAYPFRYEWKKGMRVSDLIPDKEALVTPDYWKKRNSVELPRISSLDRGQDVQSSQDGQNGQDRKDGKRRKSWLDDDLAVQHPGINWDYAVVERFDWKDLKSHLVPFNLGRAVLDHDPSQNIELQPGDVVTVFSMSDMKVPMEKQSRIVTIEGEVANAGVYQARAGETLRQLIARTGGLTQNAYLFGAVFTRESTRKLQQQRLEESIKRMEQDIRKNAGAAAQGAMDQKALDAAKYQAESQQAALEKLKQVKATGRIILEIPPGADALKDIPDIALEDGDRLYVPAIPSTVGVFGDVYNENNAFFFRNGKRVSDYLDQAGGPTRDADSDRIFVLRADGSVVSSQTNRGFFSGGFESMRLMPGDAVVVPEKMDKTPFVKSFVDWTQILLNMGVGIASLKVIGVI